MNSFKKRAYIWVTLIFFCLSLVGHWTFGWLAYVDDAEAHHQPVRVREGCIELARDTLENWQSEFLQLVWQVGGLMFLLAVGSPQSKEGDERREAKLDFLLRSLEGGDAKLAELDTRYPRK